jgi:hypothetical protein
MSILDKVSKETLQNVKMVLPRKKTGDIVSSYGTNAWNITIEHRMFLETLRNYYNNNNSKFNPDALPHSTITRTLFTISALTYESCVGLYEERRNILVIPNWKENEHEALYDVANTTTNYDPFNPTHNFTPNSILALCLWPIWKRQVNGYHSITIALPNEYTLLEKILVDYGFEHKIARQSKLYKLGDNTYSGFTVNKIPSHLEKFDVVQLIGHDRPEEGKTFKAKDIKDDFKRYCKDDFLLHDLWRPNLNMKDQLTNWNNWYRGIEGTPNEKAVQSLKEFKSYQQSMDWGYVLADNNDSDMSTIMEEGFSNSNPYLMHSDSDVSNSTMISAKNRKSEVGFSQTFKEASRMVYEKTKNQYIPIF